VTIKPKMGEYTISCSVPGHRGAGMQGMLFVPLDHPGFLGISQGRPARVGSRSCLRTGDLKGGCSFDFGEVGNRSVHHDESRPPSAVRAAE